jgi:hypothetical protein
MAEIQRELRGGEPQTSYEEDCFRTLLAEFDAFTPTDANGIHARVNELRQKKPIDAFAITELELLVLRLASHEELLQILPPLRKKVSAITGEDVPKVPIEQLADPVLRSEAAYLTVQLHKFYVLNDRFEETRQRLIRHLFWTMLVVTGVIGAVTFGEAHVNHHAVTVLTAVLFAGMFGGFTSCLRRVYTFNRGTDPISAMQALTASRASMLASPVLGVIFALGIYLCLLGGILNGNLFPNLTIQGISGRPITFPEFFGTVEGSPGDFAKLMLWAFLAGFAERLVPDVLDTFTAGADKK